MSSNKERPHLVVLPEDRANSDLANGFVSNVNLFERAIQILPYERGWQNVVEKFKSYHLQKMREYPERRIVLLMDFDGQFDSRLSYVENEIPDDLKSRVFVLGVTSEPEKLRSATGMKFEAIGQALAKDCDESKKDFWSHELLKHNEPELERLFADVRPFLFH